MIRPWKCGLKGIKPNVKIEFTAKLPATIRNHMPPREYGWYSNLNPGRPDARWSQARESVLPDMKARPTLMYNGYEEFVANLGSGEEFQVAGRANGCSTWGAAL